MLDAIMSAQGLDFSGAARWAQEWLDGIGAKRGQGQAGPLVDRLVRTPVILNRLAKHFETAYSREDLLQIDD